jgi:hypothetical protein
MGQQRGAVQQIKDSWRTRGIAGLALEIAEVWKRLLLPTLPNPTKQWGVLPT